MNKSVEEVFFCFSNLIQIIIYSSWNITDTRKRIILTACIWKYTDYVIFFLSIYDCHIMLNTGSFTCFVCNFDSGWNAWRYLPSSCLSKQELPHLFWVFWWYTGSVVNMFQKNTTVFCRSDITLSVTDWCRRCRMQCMMTAGFCIFILLKIFINDRCSA